MQTLAPITHAVAPERTPLIRIAGITNQILVVAELASASGGETSALINGF